ncbi:MAG: hypothetical protein ACT4PL_04145 [Phycisphaerales bacterium]
MAETRRQTCEDAARALEHTFSLSALVGFDGFVDAIIDVVESRASMAPLDYRPLETIRALAERIGSAEGRSTNIEAVVKERRFGGNGPLMAGGLAALGVRTSFIGCIGREDDWSRPDPLFEPFAARCQDRGGEVVSVGPPARTDALEFMDGKIMFNHALPLAGVTWDLIRSRAGDDRLRRLVRDAGLISVVNWTNMGCVGAILEGLTDLLAPAPRSTRVFVDLSDPAKRTDSDLLQLLRQLRGLDRAAPVTLGLNLSEAVRVAAVAGVQGVTPTTTGGPLERGTITLRAALGIDALVIHPREGAAGATAAGASAWFDGPLTARPRLSTGAGDHFNAGFALAQSIGISLPGALAVGCAVSGAYVRDAQSPSLPRTIALLKDMPGPESAP